MLFPDPVRGEWIANGRLSAFAGMALLAAGWLALTVSLPARPQAWLVAASGLPLLAAVSWRSARAAGEPWRPFIRRTADVHALAVVLLAALGVQFEDAHGVTTDGVIYFTQLRSAVFDGDLEVAAEFAFLQQPPRPSHVVPIGPTLVWLPLYLVVAAVDAVGRALGWIAVPDEAVGLTLPFVRAALVSSFAIGAAGLIVVHRRLRREFSPGVAFLASLLLFGATPLFWYMVYEPSMTHAASFGLVALFVVAAERWTTPDVAPRRAIALGALLGLAFVTRPQEALFALFPATLMLMAHAPWRARLVGAARLAGWAFVGTLPFLLLQAWHATLLLSRERFAVAGESGYLDLLDSRWADTLWSSWHGFFSWSPVAYLAVFGVIAYVVRQRAWAVATLLILFLMAWINGATTDWAGGWSFGGRRFTSMLVVLAPGMAMLVHALTARPTVALALMAAAAIAWNQLLVAQYARGMLRRGEPARFADIVRQQADLATRPPFVYPFAFPANVWFAWRTGLPIERYDLLGPEAWEERVAVAMTPAAAKYLFDGWGAQVGDPFGDLWWMDAPRAEIAVPLDRAAPATLTVRARTRQMEGAAPVTLRVLVNGEAVGTFTPPTDTAGETSFAVPASTLRRGFNRIVFEKPPETPPVGVYEIAIN